MDMKIKCSVLYWIKLWKQKYLQKNIIRIVRAEYELWIR